MAPQTSRSDRLRKKNPNGKECYSAVTEPSHEGRARRLEGEITQAFLSAGQHSACLSLVGKSRYGTMLHIGVDVVGDARDIPCSVSQSCDGVNITLSLLV